MQVFYIMWYTTMLQEFMDFLATYNVVGLAVGLLIGAKVGAFVKGIVEDLVTPLIFSPILKKLRVNKLEELSWRGVLYWKVIATTIDFLITAIVIFIVVKNFDIPTK